MSRARRSSGEELARMHWDTPTNTSYTTHAQNNWRVLGCQVVSWGIRSSMEDDFESLYASELELMKEISGKFALNKGVLIQGLKLCSSSIFFSLSQLLSYRWNRKSPVTSLTSPTQSWLPFSEEVIAREPTAHGHLWHWEDFRYSSIALDCCFVTIIIVREMGILLATGM